MADVLVRQCTIRVVRRGGWSWGREPRKLLDRALRLIPELIAAELTRLFSDDVTREIAAPVRLAIALPLALLRDAERGLTGASSQSRGAEVELAARITQAVRKAFAPPDSDSVVAPARDAPPDRSAPPLPPAVPADPLGVLADWARRGRLIEQLRGFSPPALRAWHDWIVAVPVRAAPASDAAAAACAMVAPLLGRLLEESASPGADEIERVRQRIIAFATLEAAGHGVLHQRAVRDRIDTLLPAPARSSSPAAALGVTTASASATTAARRQADAAAAAPIVPRAVGPAAPSLSPALAWDVHVESALPFLLLAALARVGYLDAVSAVLAAARRPDALPLFAAMLAYKVLAPPARGWSRSAGTRAVAAVFALLPEAPEDRALAAVADAVADQISPLDTVIAAALIDGHRPGTPLLLTTAGPLPGDRLLLSDVDGAFPIAVAADATALVAPMRRVLQDVVLVPAVAAAPATLAALARAQLRFVTDAPPCRGEHWRIVRGHPGESWWSNDELTPDARLATAARRMPQASDAATACWHAIGIERPSVPRRSDACDDSLTLAASLALGSMAWELWREREPTSPQLALARFHDLDARIRVDPTSVRVLLPMGRRFFDLREHRLLDDVEGVPWFGGRILRFASG
jgi:hypothetical protein